jgi:uroporphyrinogen III methyltransferase/synthase
LKEAPVGAGLVIVGKVVNFRDHLRWFDSRPLFGRLALAMHSKEEPDDLADLLRSQGAEVIGDDDGRVDIYRLLLDRKIDLVTFTSASAVLNFAAKLGADQASDLLAHTVVAVQGAAAADAATRANISPAVEHPAGPIASFAEAIVNKFRGN